MGKSKKSKQTNSLENREFGKEDAYKTLEFVNGWIGNMDAKISFALAFVGILVGYIFSNGLPQAFERVANADKLSELNGGEIFAAVVVALLYVASFASIFCFMMAVIARIKNTNGFESIFFFGTIGKMDLINYKTKVDNIIEKEIIADLEEQIHTNSKICSKKAKWYNNGIKWLLITIFLWFICTIFRII